MTTHMLLTENLPLGSALEEFTACNDEFDKHPYRRIGPNSPHAQMTDIWVRYQDMQEILRGESAKQNHESVWYPVVERLPSVRKIAFTLMSFLDGERLGGILVTKLPPGGRILPHADGGWHASYYDKFYVPITAPEGSYMGFEDGNIVSKPGQVWWFDNSNLHWVENPSQQERISMIVCIRTDKFASVNKRRI
jgi:Aspartyl/Asparaginyl beta-hydroxylase